FAEEEELFNQLAQLRDIEDDPEAPYSIASLYRVETLYRIYKKLVRGYGERLTTSDYEYIKDITAGEAAGSYVDKRDNLYRAVFEVIRDCILPYLSHSEKRALMKEIKAEKSVGVDPDAVGALFEQSSLQAIVSNIRKYAARDVGFANPDINLLETLRSRARTEFSLDEIGRPGTVCFMENGDIALVLYSKFEEDRWTIRYWNEENQTFEFRNSLSEMPIQSIVALEDLEARLIQLDAETISDSEDETVDEATDGQKPAAVNRIREIQSIITESSIDGIPEKELEKIINAMISKFRLSPWLTKDREYLEIDITINAFSSYTIQYTFQEGISDLPKRTVTTKNPLLILQEILNPILSYGGFAIEIELDTFLDNVVKINAAMKEAMIEEIDIDGLEDDKTDDEDKPEGWYCSAAPLLPQPETKYLLVNGRVFLHDTNCVDGRIVAHDGSQAVATSVNTILHDQIRRHKENRLDVNTCDVKIVVFLDGPGGKDEITMLQNYLGTEACKEIDAWVVGKDIHNVYENVPFSKEAIAGVINENRTGTFDEGNSIYQYFVAGEKITPDQYRELNPNYRDMLKEIAATDKKVEFKKAPTFFDAAEALFGESVDGVVKDSPLLVMSTIKVAYDLADHLRQFIKRVQTYNETILQAA
ncbi:MAG: hypothetical protein ABIH47_02540, partial [Candidatus Omnitrophota bacterium]